jgi:hypothetical protein
VPQPPPNPQTIASLAGYGHCFVGACANGHPARIFRVDMERLIARLGPDALVRDAMQKISCAACGAKVEVTIGSAWPATPHDPLTGHRAHYA